jgi:hypothetical protein
MAQRPKKFPAMDGLARHLYRLGDFLKTGDAKSISYVAIDWQKAERGYGQQLSADVRQAITDTTNIFVLFEESESKGTTVASVRTTIEAFKKRVNELQKSLLHLRSEPDALVFIGGRFNDRNFRSLRLLHDFLALFDDACNAALGELRESYSFVKEGNAWHSWIRGLKQIMKNNGLPARARKDVGNKSRSDKHSPFVELVWELQLCIPTESRRHMHSKAALADAIGEIKTVRAAIAKQDRGPKVPVKPLDKPRRSSP